jgi:prefoldin subunit 5
MNDRERLTKQLQEAERELDAARTLPALNAAAKKLQRVRAELKALEAEEKPKRRASLGRGSAGASS